MSNFPLLEQENPQFRKHLIELGTEISQMQDALAYLTKNNCGDESAGISISTLLCAKFFATGLFKEIS